MIFSRKTVSRPVKLRGRGLHSGQPVKVVIYPSSQGINFCWNSERILARPENVSETKRCTKLGPISTVEHLMSAFAAVGITDADVDLDAPELPALDGSALPYCEAMESNIELLGESHLSGLFARIFEKSPDYEVAIGPGNGDWRYEFKTEIWPEEQRVEFHCDYPTYREEIAPARTFGFHTELASIRKAGLAQGLDESSALIIGEKSYVNNARFSDEPARHKLLDLIGDLYLSGVPILLLNVVAVKSGHSANVQAALKLSRSVHIESA